VPGLGWHWFGSLIVGRYDIIDDGPEISSIKSQLLEMSREPSDKQGKICADCTVTMYITLGNMYMKVCRNTMMIGGISIV
jgi:hypothetical protein